MRAQADALASWLWEDFIAWCAGPGHEAFKVIFERFLEERVREAEQSVALGDQVPKAR